MGLFSSIGHFISGAAKVVEAVVTTVGKVVYDAVTVDISSTIHLIEALAHGQRLDKALLADFREHLKVVQEVAPYAQTVITFVPGIGPAASAAIGGGLALAEGKTMDEVAMSAIAGALPGGAFVHAAYDMGKDVIQHKPVLTVVTQGLGVAASGLGFAAGGAGGLIDAASQSDLVAGLQEAHDIAAGVKTTVSSVDAIGNAVAKMKLTEPQKKQFLVGLKVGAAVGHAQNVQQAHCKDMRSPAKTQLLLKQAAALQKDPVIKAARAGLHNVGLRGYDIGTGAMHTKGVVEYTLQCLRGSLSGPDQTGFDTALALKMGRVKAGAAVAALAPAVQAGHAIAHGLDQAPAIVRAAIKPLIKKDPGLVQGATVAAGAAKWQDLFLTGGGLLIGAMAGGPLWAAVGAGTGFSIGLLTSSGRLKDILK